MTTPLPTRWENAADKLTNAIPYVGGIAIIIPSIYMIWFLYQGQSLSSDTADWGTFGDFVGGILNPVVAFFALLLLMVSIGIQREELKATRKELKEANDHQARSNLKEDIHRAILSIEENINRALNQKQWNKITVESTLINFITESSDTGLKEQAKNALYNSPYNIPIRFMELEKYLTQYKEISGNTFYTAHMKSKYSEVTSALAALADEDAKNDLDYFLSSDIDDIRQISSLTTIWK